MMTSATMPNGLQSPTVERLAQCTGARAIVLFGSRQRGVSGPGSDIDVVVIGPCELPTDERRGHLARLFAHWPVRIDALWLTPEEALHRIRVHNHFLVSVLADGQPVYGDVEWLRAEIRRMRTEREGRAPCAP